jgi:hypothetical protein
VGRKPDSPYLARPATNGQPREMTAHRELSPTRQSRGEPPSLGLRATNNSTQPLLNPYTVAQPNGCCLLGPPCYRGSEGTCIIKIKDHKASAPAETSVWPECSERAAHYLTQQEYPDPSKPAPPQREPEECILYDGNCLMDVTSRGWSRVCNAWSTISEPSNQISYYVLFEVLIPVAA